MEPVALHHGQVFQQAREVSSTALGALEQAVRRVTAIRQTALADLQVTDLTERLPQFTARARAVLQLAIDQARADGAPSVGTGHLLGGLLAEGGNLGLQVLRAIEIEPPQVARDLARHSSAEPGAVGDDPAQRFSGPAANALELTVTEAQVLGHNYVGCEHLLLGLIAEPDGIAGQVLRGLGAEPRLTRRAVAAALAGYVHLRAQTKQPATATATAGDPAQALAAAVREELQPLIERIERLEQRAGLSIQN